jgi:hypothetical protein
MYLTNGGTTLVRHTVRHMVHLIDRSRVGAMVVAVVVAVAIPGRRVVPPRDLRAMDQSFAALAR